MKTLDKVRNVIFDIYPEIFVVMSASFRAEKIFTKALWNGALISDPEEIQQLVQIETEKFYRTSITAFLLKIFKIGTPQKIKDTYQKSFFNVLNIKAESAIKALNQPQ